MIKCIKKTLLFFSCFAWTQPLLSLSTLSLWQNINKRNNQEFLDKTPKKQKRYEGNQSSASLTNRRESDHSKKPYKCNKKRCTKEYTNLSNFKEHLLLHDNPLAFQCDVADCYIKLSTKRSLKRHRATHSSQQDTVKEVCDICSNSFLSTTSLIHHKKINHNPEHPFRCTICQYTYANEKSYLRHCRTHTNSLSCFFCISDQTYASNGNLNEHTRQQHSYYKCKYKDCNEAFILGSFLYQHMEKEHGFPSLSCPECSQSFHGLLTLYQHRYMEHKKQNKNDFIEFFKDLITKNVISSYLSHVENSFLNSLFSEKQVLIDTLFSNLEIAIDSFARPIDESSRPIETLLLYKKFIENITSNNIPKLEELSLDVLLSYECYLLYLSDDSAIELLLLKDILSIIIQIRNSLGNPLETSYKEMLDILYTKDTNQFSDEEYRLFMQTFENLFFKKKISTSEQIKMVELNSLNKSA